MENGISKRNKKRARRTLRNRKHVRGTEARPRLSVFKSNVHLSAQIIDDEKGVTLAGLGTLSKEFQGTKFAKKSKEAAKEIGSKLAVLAKSKGVNAVVFDRGRLKYHGVIAELANAAREAGLQF